MDRRDRVLRRVLRRRLRSAGLPTGRGPNRTALDHQLHGCMVVRLPVHQRERRGARAGVRGHAKRADSRHPALGRGRQLAQPGRTGGASVGRRAQRVRVGQRHVGPPRGRRHELRQRRPRHGAVLRRNELDGELRADARRQHRQRLDARIPHPAPADEAAHLVIRQQRPRHRPPCRFHRRWQARRRHLQPDDRAQRRRRRLLGRRQPAERLHPRRGRERLPRAVHRHSHHSWHR
mmetsp:Transcript_27280/g.40323  ORF Transcript_27280/g.40323 Transcript_27280/m.40323 type:complete len:234 (+) Transcript_27280:958-1659(+)